MPTLLCQTSALTLSDSVGLFAAAGRPPSESKFYVAHSTAGAAAANVHRELNPNPIIPTLTLKYFAAADRPPQVQVLCRTMLQVL